MTTPQPPAGRPPMLASQRLWATIGLLLVGLTFALAFDNLRTMYASAEDFVVGSLLSVAGFCFGKAFTRTHEKRALELVSDPTPAMEFALRQEMLRRLHERGVGSELSLLVRHIEAASERLSEHYSAQAGLLEVNRQYSVLMVAMGDIDLAAASTRGIASALDMDTNAAILPDHLSPLITVRADLREAIGRRDQVVQWLIDTGRFDEPEIRDLVSIMSADLLKALRQIETMIRQRIADPSDDMLQVVRRYLDTAAIRLQMLEQAIAGQEVAMSRIVDVLREDLSNAQQRFERFATQDQALVTR